MFLSRNQRYDVFIHCSFVQMCLSILTVSQVSNVAHGPFFMKKHYMYIILLVDGVFFEFLEYEHSAMDPVQ